MLYFLKEEYAMIDWLSRYKFTDAKEKYCSNVWIVDRFNINSDNMVWL